MDEALTIIAYQRERLREKEEYIHALEVVCACLGFAAIALLVGFVYLAY
ncbi:MAG: hypothetical protein RR446_09605 [Lachnospiraceae bacterium]